MDTMKMAFNDLGSVAYNINGCLDCRTEGVEDDIEAQNIVTGKIAT